MFPVETQPEAGHWIQDHVAVERPAGPLRGATATGQGRAWLSPACQGALLGCPRGKDLQPSAGKPTERDKGLYPLQEPLGHLPVHGARPADHVGPGQGCSFQQPVGPAAIAPAGVVRCEGARG